MVLWGFMTFHTLSFAYLTLTFCGVFQRPLVDDSEAAALMSDIRVII